MSRAHMWIVAVALAGCGGSVLVHKDDDIYRRAITNFQRTRRLVAESLAPDDEQAMFLEAEGLFRYRFETPGRSFGSYLALAGGALVQLPVLDSLAGSLDLFSLRLKAFDGAVQMWETLLERDPTTPLRPLALYRLGWAYRNSIASGFPRDSTRAFDEIAACCRDSPVAPFAAQAKRAKWKSQGRATAWSLVPGLGQMYVGEYGNGAVRLAVALAAGAMMVIPAVIAYERRSDLSWHGDWPLFVVFGAGATILAIDYSSSYQDAMRAVLEYNEHNEREFERAHPDA